MLTITSFATYEPTEIQEFEVNGVAEVRKTYLLPISEKPTEEMKVGFTQNGQDYVIADIIEEGVTTLDTQEIVETVELTTKTSKIDDILPLLEPTMEHTTEDEYSGVLELDITSIKVDIAGYGSSTKTLTEKQTYPNLSSADMSHIPQTVTIGGLSYKFESVDWQSSNDIGVDGHSITNRYSAVVTYTTTQKTSYVTGYIVTADYLGTVSKDMDEMTQYVVIFQGSPVVESVPEENLFTDILPELSEEEVSTGFSWLYILIPFVLFVFPPLCYFGVKALKNKMYENKGEF